MSCADRRNSASRRNFGQPRDSFALSASPYAATCASNAPPLQANVRIWNAMSAARWQTISSIRSGARRWSTITKPPSSTRYALAYRPAEPTRPVVSGPPPVAPGSPPAASRAAFSAGEPIPTPTASTTAAAVPRCTAPAIPATCTTAVTVWRLKTRKKARRSTESASRSPLSGGSASVFDDAVGPVSIEALAPLEELELDQEGEPDHVGLELADEVDRSEDRAPGGEQVVDDEHSLPGKDGV